MCNAIRQELIEGGTPHDFATVKARVVQMMHSPSTVAFSVPPKQLQSFGNSLPKESQSIGGQSHAEWKEIEMRKFKARQTEMWARIRQEREALQIQKEKSVDSDNKVISVIEKAESNITCTESTTEEVLPIIGTNEKNNGSNNKCNSVIEKA